MFFHWHAITGYKRQTDALTAVRKKVNL